MFHACFKNVKLIIANFLSPGTGVGSQIRASDELLIRFKEGFKETSMVIWFPGFSNQVVFMDLLSL